MDLFLSKNTTHNREEEPQQCTEKCNIIDIYIHPQQKKMMMLCLISQLKWLQVIHCLPMESDLTRFLIIVAIEFGACLILFMNASSFKRYVDITAAEKFSAVVVGVAVFLLP